MARNIHLALSYEKRLLAKKMYQIRILSDVLYELDSVFDRARLDQVIWTWESGLTFSDLKKEEFKKVKNILKKYNLSKLQKTSNEEGIKLEGVIAEKYLNSKHGDMKAKIWVDFNWKLPDTCKITYKTTLHVADKERFRVIDGVIHEEVIVTEVDCKKPVLSSVFDAATA
jgi:hypothetical protein